MGNFKVVAKEIREQVIHRIKQEGISVGVAAADAGISTKTVYNWLSRGISKEPGVLEINQLKRENQFLMILVGKLTMEKEHDRLREKK